MDNRIDVCRFKDKRKRKADFPDLKGAFEMKCSQLLEHIEYTCLQGSTDVKAVSYTHLIWCYETCPVRNHTF